MTDMDKWCDLDEIFVSTIRGRRHGSGFISVLSTQHTTREDQAATDVEMVLADDAQDLGEVIGPDATSGKKRQADRDPSPDDALAHGRAKKKQQRCWLRKQNKKAKMHAWMQAAGLEVAATTITVSPTN